MRFGIVDSRKVTNNGREFMLSFSPDLSIYVPTGRLSELLWQTRVYNAERGREPRHVKGMKEVACGGENVRKEEMCVSEILYCGRICGRLGRSSRLHLPLPDSVACLQREYKIYGTSSETFCSCEWHCLWGSSCTHEAIRCIFVMVA